MPSLICLQFGWRIIYLQNSKMNLTNSRQKNSPQLLDQSKCKHISLLYQQIHFNLIKLKMAANNMSNVYVSLSTLMLFQQGKLYNLQQQMHGISRSSRPEVFCKKAAVKSYAKFTGKHLYWSLFLIKLQAFRPTSVNDCFCISNITTRHRIQLNSNSMRKKFNLKLRSSFFLKVLNLD